MKMFGHFVLTIFHFCCIVVHIAVGAQRFPTVLNNTAFRAPTHMTGNFSEALCIKILNETFHSSLQIINCVSLSFVDLVGVHRPQSQGNTWQIGTVWQAKCIRWPACSPGLWTSHEKSITRLHGRLMLVKPMDSPMHQPALTPVLGDFNKMMRPHTSLTLSHQLSFSIRNSKASSRVINRNSEHIWAPHSPDLSCLNFSLCCMISIQVYKFQPTTNG